MTETTWTKENLQTLPRDQHSTSLHPPLKSRIFRVGLLGLGTVGQGLCRLVDDTRPLFIERHGIEFCITRVLVRDLKRPRGVSPVSARLVDRLESFLDEDYDLVVESMGGIEPAGRIIAAVLERGIPVVTANKALMAERGDALLALAAGSGANLRFEASVAAGIPILGLIERALKSMEVIGVNAVLNGTSNYILTRLTREGDTLPEALREAKRLGYAEANPMLDISGMDAAQKLAVLSRTLGRPLDLADVEITGLEQVNPGDCARARSLGYVVKPVAVADYSGGAARGYVAPALVPEEHPLAGVWDAGNGILLSGEPLGALFLSGPGAGALPTAASMLDDLLSLALDSTTYRSAWIPEGIARRNDALSAPPESLPGRWFLSLTLEKNEARVEDLLDFMAAAGVVFRELREFQDGDSFTLAGITVRTTHVRIKKLESRLDAIQAVESFRAFRVVDPAVKEEKE